MVLPFHFLVIASKSTEINKELKTSSSLNLSLSQLFGSGSRANNKEGVGIFARNAYLRGCL